MGRRREVLVRAHEEEDVEALWRVMHQPMIRAVDLILDVEYNEITITNNLQSTYVKIRKSGED